MNLTQWELKMKENVQSVMDRLNVSVGATASKVDRLQETVKKAEGGFSGLKNIAGGVLAGIGASFAISGAAALGQDIFRLTAEQAKYNAVLTNTFQSQSKARESMQMIKDLATTTPFQVDELTQSYIKLVNQGFEPTKNQLAKLGDLASAVGKPFDQLAEAILDAQTMQFERLKEFGIKAEKNGDKVAFSFKGVRTEVDANSASIQNYLIGLGDLTGVAGSMAAIMDTPLGKLSNLQDTFDALKIQIGNQIMPIAIELMQTLTEGINVVSVALEWMRQNWGLIEDALLSVGVAVGVYAAAWAILNAQLIVATVQTGLLTAAQWLLNIAMNANPIGLIITGIAALIGAVVLLWKRFDWFRGGVMAIFEGLKAYVFGWFTFMKDILLGIGTLLLGVLTLDMGKITEGFELSKNAFVNYATGIKNAVVKGYNDGVSEVNNELANESNKERSPGKSFVPGSTSAASKTTTTAKDQLQKGISGVSEGGKSVRNINLRADKLAEINVTSSTGSFKETAGQIKIIVEETILRALNGAELALQ